MKNWTKVVAGVIALMLLVVCASAESAAEMPVPFGMASSSAPYYAKPCNERLASLPEALMKLADGGYSWEYDYVADKPAYALTLMDYANIYSFIHDHALDADAVCGYDDTSLTYRDPNAGTTVIIDYDTFSKSFDELGGRIVYYPAQD